MKKTLTINLSGIIFHIDEDAYEMLGNYLNAIRKSFSASEGRDEIMTDIESRIAEMMQEKVGQAKQVVTIADVEQVINTMGKPEEFGTEPGELGSEPPGDLGTSSTDSSAKSRRRIFRDPDDKILGGVCSGIGAYVDFDPIWIRLVFALTFFFFGSGFLFYLILWMVIPKAKTSADKLEMRGEPVNIDNIGRTINEEAQNLRKKVNQLKNEIGSKEYKEKINHTTNRLVGFLAELFGTFFRMFGRIIAYLLIVTGIFLLVFLLASLFGVYPVHLLELGNLGHYSIRDFGNLIFGTPQLMNLALLGGSLLLGIPILMMIYGGFRILFNFQPSNKLLNLTFKLLWVTGLLICIYVGLMVSRDFKVKVKTEKSIVLYQPKSNILYLKVNTKDRSGKFLEEDNDETGSEYDLIRFDEKSITLTPVTLNIVPSETDSFGLILTGTARGEGQKDAMNKAKRIKYSVRQFDSLIEFDYSFVVQSSDKWRGQKIQLTLEVPPNKIVWLDESMKYILNDIKNSSNTTDEEMVNRRWMMGSSELSCIDCRGLDRDDTDDHRYLKHRRHRVHSRSGNDVVKINSDGIDMEDSEDVVKISKEGIRIREKK